MIENIRGSNPTKEEEAEEKRKAGSDISGKQMSKVPPCCKIF
jgi:hypothetical protein